MAVSQVYLVHGTTGGLVEARLYDSISQQHLDQHQQRWKPLLRSSGEEHEHWDWERKWTFLRQQANYQSFAIEVGGEVQGLMIVDTSGKCRLPGSGKKRLVYVEYLEVAPWNRREATKSPRYKAVGSTLMSAAIQLSIDIGNGGRIGLHSLPQADTFYRIVCGMTELGPDPSKQDLHYFEMTDQQALSFFQR